ncbi:cell division protein FtsK [Microbacterium sp. NEAU-LLC]|uniref:Cell division protein FtsK n=1 Tax=Microbacterium helvum TaxID=2773713 RepID=A0ABR8NRY7_9MICO|nr:FtsK/SpoIIIE domain-containing protein [Microbacterium helvum]MBD3943380.1 cell division protein FtsK [Microbacterium helvum]
MRTTPPSRLAPRALVLSAADADDILDDEALTLPPAWTPPQRPPLPVVAAVVPVVGAVALWLVTGSVFALWFALLGPLIAAATLFDARRAARRDGRRAAAAAVRARERVRVALDVRHDAERTQLWLRHPDVSRFDVREDDIWRGGAVGALVVGAGDRASAMRVTGGDGDPDAAALRRRAARVSGAPIAVPAAAGVVVVGPDALAAAVQRALVLQLCLAHAPGELGILEPVDPEFDWSQTLPHRLGARPAVRLAIVAPGGRVPAEADVAVARCRPGDPLPPRCAAVISVSSPDAAHLDHAGESLPLQVEALSLAQAEAIVAVLAARAEHSLGISRDAGEPIALADLRDATPEPAGGGLPAVIGITDRVPFTVDLVHDGPHAIVAGVTGSGKSELLITWVLALCATRTTDEVTFLLADFKGGTAFDALAGVPHVTGVITDLDGAGARRAIESLRAELRRRESAIAAAGARDILDPRVRLPRLVVVVDEFAALLADHPELHAVFADLAARGRALGIHLVLGTQRAAGVIRENLLANCPLRLSLRVTDPSDSRAILGVDDAAHLPGGVSGRGSALVRRASDSRPVAVRIALSGPDDVAATALRTGERAPQRPWLPELPRQVTLDELERRPPAVSGASTAAGELLLGVADEPERQRQPTLALSPADRALLVVGGPGSGVSNTLALVGAQATRSVRVPADAEGLWDAVAALAEQPPTAGTVVLVDDLDAVGARLPAEYAQTLWERLDAAVRRAADEGAIVVAGAHRMTGPVSRLAELFPKRLLLPYPTRMDHAAAGGEPASFDPGAPAGRGWLDGRTVQIALAPSHAGGASPLADAPIDARTSGDRRPPWEPAGRLTGLVARRSPASRAALAAWEARGITVSGLDAYAADPTAGGAAAERVVVAGEPEDWQRHWRLLADIRGDHDLVVDTSCAAELRVLVGYRGVAPYCEPGRGRAWLVAAGADPVRIVLPASDSGRTVRTVL